MPELPQKSHDNQMEDYFLKLVVEKHLIEREINDLIVVVDQAWLHPDYAKLVKQVLFGEKNLYLENWGTLETNLIDMIKSYEIRENKYKLYGVVLEILLRVIEEVFDVDDQLFMDFLICEEREDIEHRLIIIIKRVLYYIESGLRELLTHTEHLDEPIEDHARKEFSVIEDSLKEYMGMIMDTEGDKIRDLKSEVDELVTKLQKKRELKK